MQVSLVQGYTKTNQNANSARMQTGSHFATLDDNPTGKVAIISRAQLPCPRRQVNSSQKRNKNLNQTELENKTKKQP